MLRPTGYASFTRTAVEAEKKGEVSENIINISSLIARPKNLTWFYFSQRLCSMKGFNVIHEISSVDVNVKEFPIQAEVEIKMR